MILLNVVEGERDAVIGLRYLLTFIVYSLAGSAYLIGFFADIIG
jgi:hypothetical protein